MGFFAVIMLILLGVAGFYLMGRLDMAKKRKIKKRCERELSGRM